MKPGARQLDSAMRDNDTVTITVRVEWCRHSARVVGHTVSGAPHVVKFHDSADLGEFVRGLARDGYDVAIRTDRVEVSLMDWYGCDP